MFDANYFDADYFLRGKETGKSLYTDYRWLPELTIPMAGAIVNHLGITYDHKILDFGCARGYTVKALRHLGYDAFGVDVSEWAIENADESTKPYLSVLADSLLLEKGCDWVIAKDVLEHVQYVANVVPLLMGMARVGVFVVVPLSATDGGRYVVEDYEKDVTHVHRLTLATWAKMFMHPGWSVEASYRVKGVKDNYYKPGWEAANGFITARRIQ